MLARARQDVYWPGLDRDLNVHVSACKLCQEISPSQQKEPLISSPLPHYPSPIHSCRSISNRWLLLSCVC